MVTGPSVWVQRIRDKFGGDQLQVVSDELHSPGRQLRLDEFAGLEPPGILRRALVTDIPPSYPARLVPKRSGVHECAVAVPAPCSGSLIRILSSPTSAAPVADGWSAAGE